MTPAETNSPLRRRNNQYKPGKRAIIISSPRVQSEREKDKSLEFSREDKMDLHSELDPISALVCVFRSNDIVVFVDVVVVGTRSAASHLRHSQSCVYLYASSGAVNVWQKSACARAPGP